MVIYTVFSWSYTVDSLLMVIYYIDSHLMVIYYIDSLLMVIQSTIQTVFS